MGELMLKNDDSDDFNRFWKLWLPHCRKTDGRGKAGPAYHQMIEAGADPDDILDGAAWFLRTLTERDKPYIPLAASWLRSERWADDCHKEREFQARQSQRQQEQENVVSMRRVLPEGHFSRKWAAMKQE